MLTRVAGALIAVLLLGVLYGGFFLPSFAPVDGGDPQLAGRYAELLSGLREQMSAMLQGAPKAQQDEGKWLADQADLVAAHLRAKRFVEADKVADEVVRWILSVDASLEHEPGLPSFGRLSEAAVPAPR